MAITLGTELFRTLLLDTLPFGTSMIINLILTFFALLIITRNTKKWQELAFPVMIGWTIAGIPQNFLILLAGAFAMGISVLSLESIGTLLNAIKLPTKTRQAILTTKYGKEKQETKKAEEQIKRKMFKQQLGITNKTSPTNIRIHRETRKRVEKIKEKESKKEKEYQRLRKKEEEERKKQKRLARILKPKYK